MIGPETTQSHRNCCSFFRLDAGKLEPMTVAEIHELSKAIVAAGGDCFIVRRTLQRLEAGEITIERAIEALHNARRTLG